MTVRCADGGKFVGAPTVENADPVLRKGAETEWAFRFSEPQPNPTTRGRLRDRTGAHRLSAPMPPDRREAGDLLELTEGAGRD